MLLVPAPTAVVTSLKVKSLPVMVNAPVFGLSTNAAGLRWRAGRARGSAETRNSAAGRSRY